MALHKDELTKHLTSSLTGWQTEGNAIVKTFQCDDFSHAMDFVTHVADLAEEHDHHPDIDIRFDKVTITLSTHSEGGVTDKDIKLAGEIDGLA